MIRKIKSLTQNDFVNKWIIRTSSAGMFYSMFLILIIYMRLINIKIISELLLLLFCIIFALRICFRGKKLNNLDYYKINKENQKEDMQMRSYQLGDVVAGIMYALFAFSFYSNSKDTIYNILAMAFFVMLYFGLASFSISTLKFNTSCKVITLFLATIQGFIIMLFILCWILGEIANLLSLINTLTVNSSLSEEFCKIFDYKNIMAACFFVKEYNNMVFLITIISIIISIALYIILIKSVPAYQLEKLSLAFKIVSIIIVLIGIVIYFYGNSTYPYMQEYANEIKNNSQIIHEYFGNNVPYEFQNFLENYSKSEITNFGYIYFLPYTIAILVANLEIELLKSKNIKKVNLALDKIIEIYESKNNEDIDIYEKKFYYYGGEKHKMKLIRKTYGV